MCLVGRDEPKSFTEEIRDSEIPPLYLAPLKHHCGSVTTECHHDTTFSTDNTPLVLHPSRYTAGWPSPQGIPLLSLSLLRYFACTAALEIHRLNHLLASEIHSCIASSELRAPCYLVLRCSFNDTMVTILHSFSWLVYPFSWLLYSFSWLFYSLFWFLYSLSWFLYSFSSFLYSFSWLLVRLVRPLPLC